MMLRPLRGISHVKAHEGDITCDGPWGRYHMWSLSYIMSPSCASRLYPLPWAFTHIPTNGPLHMISPLMSLYIWYPLMGPTYDTPHRPSHIISPPMGLYIWYPQPWPSTCDTPSCASSYDTPPMDLHMIPPHGHLHIPSQMCLHIWYPHLWAATYYTPTHGPPHDTTSWASTYDTPSWAPTYDILLMGLHMWYTPMSLYIWHKLYAFKVIYM